MKSKTIFLLFYIFCLSGIKAGDYENYIYTTLPTNNKFIPSANCIYKEKNKYVWIGTTNGIYRFDGLEYKHYSISTDKTNNYNISGLFNDQKGNIWFTSNKGIGRYIREKDLFEIIPFPEGYGIYTNIFSYSIADEGIYFGGAGNILKYNYSTEKLEIFYKLDRKPIFNIRFINKLKNNKILFSNQHEIQTINTKNTKFCENF